MKPEEPERLLNLFKSTIKQLLERGDVSELRAELDEWKRRFGSVKANKVQFNRWDDEDATFKRSVNTGIGWTATMLERCRAPEGPHVTTTGNSLLDFGLIAMELNLGISKKENPFQPGKTDYIKPDGLGVRLADKSFCVIEAKGPQDDGNLLEATLQALCGALAIYAKRKLG